MNSETENGTTATPSFLELLLTTTETFQRTDLSFEKADPLPIIIALICIFLLLATCVSFVALCNPAGLDASRYGPYECMPYHVEDSSEPRLKLWKRLGSLRCSINSLPVESILPSTSTNFRKSLPDGPKRFGPHRVNKNVKIQRVSNLQIDTSKPESGSNERLTTAAINASRPAKARSQL
ncbi:uncharacterized protein LOC109920366 [Rhincodon typus]|uniref:uncharacterized protein LOC109920366 n=1 Tax=Rhincodon typus TaxID=259920 RepID=UPI0009A46E4C|nr:uncharacterized protein LOC109920366 [Rhincodon typus]